MTTMNLNGKARKTLASQLDRLDDMLDGLSDALNESVATAVKEAVTLAVREAVQAVLTEMLTNPAILAKMQALTGNAPRKVVRRRTWQERVAPLVRQIQTLYHAACERAQAA